MWSTAIAAVCSAAAVSAVCNNQPVLIMLSKGLPVQANTSTKRVGKAKINSCQPGLRQRRSSVQVQASTYTTAAQQAIRNAQQEACRQGSMFLAPPHLIQGLLDTEGCSASEVLNAAGMTAAVAEGAFVDKQMVPTHSIMSAGDLHWAPDARKALQIAAELCTYTGHTAAGTPHLLLGVLDCKNAAVLKALEKAGVNLAELRSKAEAASKTCDEPAAATQPAAPPETQAAQLVDQYKQWVAQHGNEPPSAGGWQQRQPPARTAADDDIYE